MAALRSRCGHYIFVPFLLLGFSSPNLSGRTLDVYHTSTHGVALVRISNACLKPAACGSLKYRTQKWRKNRQLGTIAQLCRAIFATQARINNRKKLIKQQYLLHRYLQYGKLRHTSGWDRFVSLRHPCKFQRVSRLGSVTARHSIIGRQPNFAALNRGRHLCSAGRPSRWALAHISS